MAGVSLKHQPLFIDATANMSASLLILMWASIWPTMCAARDAMRDNNLTVVVCDSSSPTGNDTSIDQYCLPEWFGGVVIHLTEFQKRTGFICFVVVWGVTILVSLAVIVAQLRSKKVVSDAA